MNGNSVTRLFTSRKTHAVGIGLAALCGLLISASAALGHEVKDLKYGAILFEFYQQKYFETLVEYDYAAERGGIHDHGNHPELLKGGVSLSYGLDIQARDIFSKLITETATEEVQNRAWFYLAKMLYLRGDISGSGETLSNISGDVPNDIGDEYKYLAALINIKLGYFDEAESISLTFDDDSPYAPYLYFNLGVAFGKQKDYSRAIANLDKSAAYADDSKELARLADRAHMAMAYLSDEANDTANANSQINLVSATGVYSNRALLGSGWTSVNNGAYEDALTPLTVLQQRSMALPEVQEAALLVPHVYEKLGLMGRAAKGFISAYDRYSETLDNLNAAKNSLQNADMLELFVSNLDAVLGESDWFGTAPSVSLNPLSPFLLDLMSDHSFQSVLKDLRDLYAIRNNLERWKRKRDDFHVIIQARSAVLDVKQRQENIRLSTQAEATIQARYNDLLQRSATLDKDDQQRVNWLLDDIRFELDSAKMMVVLLSDEHGYTQNGDHYAHLVDKNMEILEKELAKTNELIAKVENVLLELVNAELNIHEERLKYYRIQAHLAKARILDRSLAALDAPVVADSNSASAAVSTSLSPADSDAKVEGHADAK